MVSMRIPEDISAAELKKEAERRALVERAKRMYERRAARNRLIEALLTIPIEDVCESGSDKALRDLMIAIVKQEIEDREMSPTNGEINLLGPRDWWTDWNLTEVRSHPAVFDIEKGRYTEFKNLVLEHERRRRMEQVQSGRT